MIKPFYIALIYGGKRAQKYAKEMKKIINADVKSYPFIPILLDQGMANNLWDTVKQALEKANYVIAFFSDVYQATEKKNDPSIKNVTLTSPNLILELGYLLAKLPRNMVKIISDVNYEESHFIFPSDINGQYSEQISELKNDSAIKTLLSNEWGSIKKDLIEKKAIEELGSYNKLLTSSYYPNISKILSAESLDDMSLEKQLSYILDKWSSELSDIRKLPDKVRFTYETVYLYERILYLSAFSMITYKNNKRKNISSLCFQSNEAKYASNPYVIIYNTILKYITSGRSLSVYKLKSMANSIGKEIKIISELNSAKNDRKDSFILLIAKHYQALCLYKAVKKDEPDRFSHCCCSELKEAKEIMISISDTIASFLNPAGNDDVILEAYLYYNYARILIEMEGDYSEINDFFSQAISCRKTLADNNDFPLFYRLTWKHEYYYASIKKIEYGYLPNEKERLQELNNIKEQIYEEEALILVDQSFLESMKNEIRKLCKEYEGH